MTKITEIEFARIVDGIVDDRGIIIKHNPLGPDDEILLWMLLSCLISYLNLSDLETPCFTGRPDASTYREAIKFVLADKRTADFEIDQYLNKLTNDN